jgi:hypothetical protein
MEWQAILALVIAIPVILIPAVFVWYLNVGGILHAVKESRARKMAARKAAQEKVIAETHAADQEGRSILVGRPTTLGASEELEPRNDEMPAI